MKIELDSKKILINNGSIKHEIHPFWFRERVNGEQYLDKATQQRLFDPTILDSSIEIENVSLNNDILNLTFKDGVNLKLKTKNIIKEFSKEDTDINSIKKVFWNSSLNNIKNFEYKDGFFETMDMYYLLNEFYKYGFVIIKNVPTENNFLVKFANSIGSVRRTNFGEFFNVKSKPNPNDLAYTSLALAPHTDNPYRKPVPCIQILHSIINNVSGGKSTLVDGFSVCKDLEKNYPNFYKILTQIKVKFKFVDKDVVLENWSEMIELDENRNVKQVRFSPRLDFVPILKKDELDLFYAARSKISELYNSRKYRIEFRLMPGDLLMMDNHRLLHGRTKFDSNEGDRFLQGCYIEYDSTEGKLRHLKRKFNL